MSDIRTKYTKSRDIRFQPSGFVLAEVVLQRFSVKKKRCSLKFLKILRKVPIPESFFNKVEACNFVKERLWHRCFPVNFAKF